MPCRCWIGEKPQYSSEMECLIALVEELSRHKENFYFFINFSIPHQVDLAVLKKDCIFLIELKSWKGKITAKLNGDWQIDGKDNKNKNPYAQIRDQYNSLSSYLKYNKEGFLSHQKAFQCDFNDIKSYICFCPTLTLDEDKSEYHPRIKIIGFDFLHRTICQDKTKKYVLNDKEIEDLAKLLNLEYWPEIHRLASPMKTPFDFDWKKYFEGITQDNMYKDLESTYIPLDTFRIESKKNRPFSESVHLPTILDEKRKIIITAEPGAGKTTLVKKFIYEYAKSAINKKSKKLSIPVFVPLKLFDSRKDGLIGLIKYGLNRNNVDIGIEEIRELLKRKKELILIFDGLNEVSADGIFMAQQEIDRLIWENDNCKFIITSRNTSYSDWFKGIDTISITRLRQEEIIDLIRKYYLYRKGTFEGIEGIEARITDYYNDFLSNPLFARIFADILTEDERAGFKTDSILFQQFIDLVLRREREEGQLEYSPPDSEIKLLLSEIAYLMTNEDRYSLSEGSFKTDLFKLWEQLRKDNRITSAYSDIENRIQKIFLLKNEGGFISFWHPIIQEFFASEKLTKLLSGGNDTYIEALWDIKWNEVSLFALGSLEGRSGYFLDYAALGENYHLISKCLGGRAGTNAFEISRRIVEDILCSNKDEERLMGIRILGTQTDSCYALGNLLETITKEEIKLEKKYRDLGYVLWDNAKNSNISIKEIVFFNATKNEKERLRSNDFKVIIEIEDCLLSFYFSNNHKFFELIKNIDNYSITGRGFLTEIIGRIRSPEIEADIIDFLESRLNPSIESSIEVRCAAYQCLLDWEISDPNNVRLLKILVDQYKNPTASEDYGGFPSCIDRIDIGIMANIGEVPNWIFYLKKFLDKKGIIAPSKIVSYLKVLKYVIYQVESQTPFKDERFFIEENKFGLGLPNYKSDNIVILPFHSELLWELPITIIYQIVVNGASEAKDELMALCDDENLYIALLAIIGFEMSNYMQSAKESWSKERKLAENKAYSINEQFIKQKGMNYLLFLSEIADQSIRTDEISLGLKDIIPNILLKVEDKKSLENMMLEAMDKKLVSAFKICSWLEVIGDINTVEQIRGRVKKLQIEDNVRLRRILDNLKNKIRFNQQIH